MMSLPLARACVLMAPLLVAACSGPDGQPTPFIASAAGPSGAISARPTPAARAACRHRADAIYLEQNRGLLSERDSRDTPFASTGLPSNPTSGLSEMFGRDQNYSDCLRHFGPAATGSGGPSVEGAGTSPALDPSVPGPTGVTARQ